MLEIGVGVYIFLLFFGFAVGSFLNVLIYRLEKGENFVSGRSHCPHCKKQIRWYDNIPLLSFFILAGKCRDCKEKISWQYPIVEAVTGILFLAIYSLVNELRITNYELRSECFSYDFFHVSCLMFNVLWIYLLVVFSGLLAIFIYDFKHYIIPNKIIYPLIAFVLGFNLLNLFVLRNSYFVILGSWQEIILSLIIPVFFLSLIIISHGKWMGMGDVKLALFMALFLGWPDILVGAVTAFWLGTMVSLPLVFLGKKGMQSQVPFGPFLIIGAFIAYFWGGQIIDWYLKISL